MSADAVATNTTRTVLGGYRGLITPGDECDFEYAGFPLPDGTFWRYREPDATVVVEHDRLRVAVHPLTRRHDRVQILDNAKHMYFSKSRVITPDSGEVAVDVGLRARIIDGRDEDLYSGFVSVHLLDFTTGLAFDWFVSNNKAASVYARLQFPGVEPADEDDPQRPRYFCVFHEADRALSPGEEHRFRIAYDRATDTVRFFIDSDVADVYTQVPVKMGQFIIALGIMTEKLIGPQGSVSLFGQGVVAEYTEVIVEGAAEIV
jgi:uncharacterized protein DUF6081